VWLTPPHEACAFPTVRRRLSFRSNAGVSAPGYRAAAQFCGIPSAPTLFNTGVSARQSVPPGRALETRGPEGPDIVGGTSNVVMVGGVLGHLTLRRPRTNRPDITTSVYGYNHLYTPGSSRVVRPGIEVEFSSDAGAGKACGASGGGRREVEFYSRLALPLCRAYPGRARYWTRCTAAGPPGVLLPLQTSRDTAPPDPMPFTRPMPTTKR